jgi:Arc/MetJ-type ribon-helix-helix transcriptional regulator
MTTLSVKVPPSLEAALRAASQRERLSRSELVRRALMAYMAQRPDEPAALSALDAAADLVGSLSAGPTDLASNPRHMDGYGG